MATFSHLLRPGRIGPLDLRNRIIMSPMGDVLADPGGYVSDRQVDYYGARAAGGAGLLLVGSVGVAYPQGCFDTRQTGASDDRFVPGLTALAERAHAHGARIGAQLVHDGGQSLLDIQEGRPLLVPSPPRRVSPDALSTMVTGDEATAMMAPFTAPGARTEYHVATEDDIAWLIERFADAAERCVRAGFDAIELHAGHGYLIDAFLSPWSNQRDDEWGGSVERRARLLVETLGAVRERCGPNIAVWCRMNAVEHFRDPGESFEDALIVGRLAVAAGAHALHVSAYAEPNAALGITASHTTNEPATLMPYAAAMKADVDVPIITVGRIEPEVADAAIGAGQADFVAIGRKLLADPELPNKLAAGRTGDVRPCIYQYRCIGNIFVHEPVACVANPLTGREAELAPTPTAAPKRIVVIGGGPVGMEAARLLALNEHDVELWEQADRLGGRLVLAGHADPNLERYLDWQLRALERSAVSLRVGQRADVESILTARPDAVVVANGARWHRGAIPGCDLPHVHTLDAIAAWLADPERNPLGPGLVVLGHSKAALSVAHRAAGLGLTVTLVTPEAVLAPELGLPGRFRLVHDAREAGVRALTGATVEAITPEGVRISTGGDESMVPAESVLVIQPGPNLVLRDALTARGMSVHTVGDCTGATGLAIGLRAATELSRYLSDS